MLVQVRWELNTGEVNGARDSFKTVAEAIESLVPKTPNVRSINAAQIVNPEDTARLFAGPTTNKPPGA